MKIGRTIRNFVIFVAILAVMTPGAMAGTMDWTGQGADNAGELDEINCSDSQPGEMQWNFIPGNGNTLSGDENVTPNMTVSGNTYYVDTHTGGVYKFITPYISGQSLLNLLNGGAVVNYEGGLGTTPVLTISHGCPGSGIPEFPTIALPVAAILGLMFIFGRKRD